MVNQPNVPRELQVQSRVVAAAPDVTPLEPFRPAARGIVLQANTDTPISRPLGYRCKAVTIQNPGSTYKTTPNTDSIYLDIEDINLPGTGTPAANLAPGTEIPPNGSLTIEEVDPGWIHIASPTAGTRALITWGGPSSHG